MLNSLCKINEEAKMQEAKSSRESPITSEPRISSSLEGPGKMCIDEVRRGTHYFSFIDQILTKGFEKNVR